MVLSSVMTGGARTALWYVPVAERAGVARHVLDVTLAGLAGWRLVVLCPEGPLAEDLRAQGSAVITSAVGVQDGAPTAIRTVRRVLRRLGPEVLHTHLAFADVVGVAAVTGVRSGRGRRICVVSTEHGISGIEGLYQGSARQARVMRAEHRVRLRRTDAVIAVSESTRREVLRQWGDAAPVTVIRNGVDAQPRLATRPQGAGPRVLSLSRLAPEKNIDAVLEAFAVLMRAEPTSHLTIAGEGPDEARLKLKARELGIADVVTFAGHVDAAEGMAHHDVVVQLSTWENLSYTLLDAAAAGMGVVATPVGGNPEIVPERCLVEADDAEGVAAVVLDQARDPARRPEPSTTAQSVTDMCRQIAAVYEEVGS